MRNIRVSEGKKVDPMRVAKEVLDVVRESLVNALVGRRKRVEEPEIIESQIKEEFHSVFVDASCFPYGIVAFGCVIRHSKKEVVMSATKDMNQEI
ncbi:hypothetical protein RYX36_018118 [Vicia faba]